MTSRTEELLREVLALPTEERADLAAELLASLDDASPANAAAADVAWAREIERRARRVIAGQSADEPWDEFRERIARSLAKE